MNPCFEYCYIHFNKSYSNTCDEKCDYAKAVKENEKLKERLNNDLLKSVVSCLDTFKIPKDCYCINEYKEDSYCLVEKDGKWELSSYEKGNNYQLKICSTFEEGCRELIKVLL